MKWDYTNVLNNLLVGKSILDFVFLNPYVNVTVCNVLPPIATSDHSVLSLLVNASCQKSSESSFSSISNNTNKANLSIFSNILCGISWKMTFARFCYIDEYV